MSSLDEHFDEEEIIKTGPFVTFPFHTGGFIPKLDHDGLPNELSKRMTKLRRLIEGYGGSFNLYTSRPFPPGLPFPHFVHHSENHQLERKNMGHDGLKIANERSVDDTHAINNLGHEMIQEVASLLTELSSIAAMRLRTDASQESIQQVGYQLGTKRCQLRDLRRDVIGLREQLIGVNFKAAKAA